MDKALAIQIQVIEILGTDEVYLVGGSVRDLVMGNEPKDYDFTTPMLPEEMVEKVKAAGRRVYTIGEKFGTIGFKVEYTERNDYGGKENIGSWGPQWHSSTTYEYVEVTTFRSEVYTSKSRKPDVQFVASLEEDLARRDFTMNAMVLRPDGSIYDPYGGKLHIHKKHIVTVGLPKDRIQEDPLRMLRAARFAARYGFTIDANFIGKARQLADRIYDVSVERWVQELDKLLCSDFTENGLLELKNMGILTRILPEVDAVLRMYPEFEGIEFFGGGVVCADADYAWKEVLGWTGLAFMERPNDSRNKLTRYVNTGICARLKFSNNRTKIVLGMDKPQKKD